MKFFVIVAAILTIAVFSGCSENKSQNAVQKLPPKLKGFEGGLTMHPVLPGSDKVTDAKGVSEAIKLKTLPDYPGSTIGKAFGSYSHFKRTEWKETHAKGKIYADFIGWFDVNALDPESIKNGISAKGVEIKFVVPYEAPFYIAMASKIEVRTDGKTYSFPLQNLKVIIDSIYANREIIL